ncbi:thiolase family protein [Nocardioides currus]|uniref:Acetyl-CoA C-acyltransferase n=1 Tax=Nocardioides currus TaxID=2133958 RepID=A0A2R7YUN8_9ACTN|nr:thiolase family protein [Nocardioides currus]PUA80013.1 acetyl-CoA C-acyltransferase [Nocardioides currus]
MSTTEAPVVVAALRTPIGTAGHSLAALRAEHLGAPVLRALLDRLPTDLDPDDVVLGNCTGPGGNLARLTALTAGLPTTIPGLTVDRQCASGLAAVDVASQLVRGGARFVLAGGVESASTAPVRSWPAVGDTEPVPFTRAPFAPPDSDLEMGLANDLLAADAGVGRERQDAYAARSHALASAAQATGVFDPEIVPVAGVTRDDRPRAGLSVERLARLRPAFREGGTVTAGNACGISDGAAAVALVDAELHRQLDLPGLRIVASATAGVDPARPGRGLVPAVRTVLERSGITLDAVDAVEVNEAFAGQVLACCDELGLDPDRVCPEGGALALGHPWGASGAVLLVRLFSRLAVRRQGRYGLAAIAAGGGLGVAMVVEAC